jgi:DNA-directed RNA polymerase III subunit RPC1
MLADIAGANTLVLEQLVKGADLAKLMDAWDHLQLAVARYIHADYPGLPSGLYYKAQIGLCQRLKGKQGRFRGNLSGKRVDFSARTVISPDPNLSIDQVGVPLRIARTLTYPERVTSFNIDRLRASILRGPDRHPGANYVLFPDGSKRFLRFGNREEVARALFPGCVVERHLSDGDIVLFNRQPSLHRLSIMAHRVKVIAGRTFRFNECVCAPYNADFDGDEMNLHVPQTEEARAEALELLAVSNNLLSPRNGEPLIACTQDFITALYLLTHKDVFYGRQAAAQCLIWALEPQPHQPTLLPKLPEPAILYPHACWTGKQLFSAIVQADALLEDTQVRALVCCDAAEKGYTQDGVWCPADAYVCIRSAELICGQVAKRTIGAQSKQSLLYVLHREAGAAAATRCMNRLARLASRWLSEFGFSFGIDDVRPSEALEQAKAKRMTDAYHRVQIAIDAYRRGMMRPRPGYNDEETLEWHIHRLLSDLREQAGQLCLQDMAPENAAMVMALSGAKGSTINISQMVACVGQQTVNGTRVRSGFYQRTLPHFPRGDKSPEAGGFVANSFYSGMNAIEFFFHSMAGREGLVDTAVKTAETGYMQRRFMKALEDLRVEYDDTVRTSNANIVQFRFGGDGLDPLEMEATQGGAVDWERLWTTVQWLDAHQDMASEALVSRSGTAGDTALDSYAARSSTTASASATRTRPFDGAGNDHHDLRPDHLGSTAAAVPGHWPEKIREAAAALIAHRGPVTERQWQWLLALVERKLQRAFIQPGTAVGAIAAQSIGEPSTQMTLKTFHFAGVASMNITRGVPRIKELVNATRHIATPLVTAYVDPVPGQSMIALAQKVRNQLECRRLRQVTRYGEIRFQREQVYLDYVLDEGFAQAQIPTIGNPKALKSEDDTFEAPFVHRLRTQLRWPATGAGLQGSPSGSLHLRREADGFMHLQIWPACTDPSSRIASGSSRTRRHLHDLEQELSRLQRLVPELVVSGLGSVRRVVLSQARSDECLAAEEPLSSATVQLFAETEDMRSIMNAESVDATRVFCNHVLVVERVLGIEAARATMIKEILETMAAHGVTVDARHVSLLADMMSFSGEVLGITRFGIGKMRQSTLMLASFEKTVDHLFEAAVRTRADRIQGVSERVIMGRPVPLGTGMVSVGLINEAPELSISKQSRPSEHMVGRALISAAMDCAHEHGDDHGRETPEAPSTAAQAAQLAWHRQRPPGR